MAISIEFADDAELSARIKVVGVGGSGGNALNTMITSGLEGVEFIAANTDAQALESNLASTKIQLGPTLTKGLGAGGNPEVGRKAALEDVQRLGEVLAGADMVFVTAGMGGGTGTGAAPIVAQVARDAGALTVGVVTRPFSFEGRRRGRHADLGVAELMDSVDSIVTIPNEKLLALDDEDLSMLDAFQRADDVLLQAVQGISDLILTNGMINVDFADVKTIMSGTGRALMGTGYAKGERRAQEAAELAIHSPLLDELSVDGARGILINFTAGTDIKLKEINAATSLIEQAAHEDANIIFGVVNDPDMNDVVKVTVIATGFDEVDAPVEAAPRASRLALQLGVSAARPQTTSRRSVPSYRPEAARESRPPLRAQERDSRPSRAFGASALSDESVLEIPAYMRRNSNVAE
ncbi:MAG: cell division protein FtsZ [Deltaproteobacteria bacterium]|nr:cell division protein FtsZ [Deltaproteobacteria bacterium]